MNRAILRSALPACAALAALAVVVPPASAAPVAAPQVTDQQPFCPGPPLGTFVNTTVDENGVHTDHYVSIGFPLGGLIFRTRSC